MPRTSPRTFRTASTARHALPPAENRQRRRERRRSNPDPAQHRQRFAAGFAMVLTALITVNLSVPANAVEATTLVAPAAITREAPVIRAAAQTLAGPVDDRQAPGPISRDGFTVTAAPPPPPAPPAGLQLAAIAADTRTPITWPVPPSTRVSGDYGPRIAPCAGCSSFHKGADLTAGYGASIHSIGNGVVTAVSATDNGGLGVHAIIEHVVDGRVVSSLYGHMIAGSLSVHVGESVAIGQHIGDLGNTGQCTGPHLHFEIVLDGTDPVDPLAWLREHVTV